MKIDTCEKGGNLKFIYEIFENNIDELKNDLKESQAEKAEAKRRFEEAEYWMKACNRKTQKTKEELIRIQNLSELFQDLDETVLLKRDQTILRRSKT